MAKKRYINDSVWSDDWFFHLKALDKVVWLFLLTNERCNIAGVYKLSPAWAANVLNIGGNNPVDKYLSVIDNFVRDEKIVTLGEWVVLINFTRHQADNPSVRQGIARILAEVPPEVIEKIQAVHSEGTDCSTLLNFTLLNFTSKEGDEEKVKFSEEDLRLAQLLADLIKQRNPEWKLKGKIETWAEHVEKLNRIDEYTHQQIEFIIRWAQANDFWHQNILSTAKLRQKFPDLVIKAKADYAKRHSTYQKNSKPKFA